MNSKSMNTAIRVIQWLLAILILLLAMPFAAGSARAATTDDSAASGEDAAIKQAVAGFSNGWNAHDAHSMCASLADDVEWVNWREPGDTPEGRRVRQAVRRPLQEYAPHGHREDHPLSDPELAVVDDYWTMTGARKRDGSNGPIAQDTRIG